MSQAGIRGSSFRNGRNGHHPVARRTSWTFRGPMVGQIGDRLGVRLVLSDDSGPVACPCVDQNRVPRS